MIRSSGDDADWADIFVALPTWWRDQQIAGNPPTAKELGAILRFVSEKANIPTRKQRDGKVYFVDRKVISG